jgi:hypothetical protein
MTLRAAAPVVDGQPVHQYKYSTQSRTRHIPTNKSLAVGVCTCICTHQLATQNISHRFVNAKINSTAHEAKRMKNKKIMYTTEKDHTEFHANNSKLKITLAGHNLSYY